MGYADSGTEMHSIGLALSIAACPVIPSAIPIAIALGISLSNPGEMDKAANEWRECAEKLKKFSDELKARLDALPSEHWTADDKDAFLYAHKKYNGEMEKTTNIIKNLAGLLDILAGVFFALAVLAVSVGTFLLILAIFVQTWIAVPGVNAAVIATAHSIASGMITIVNPAVINTQLATAVGVSVAGGFIAGLSGSYGAEALSLGKGTPEFKDVEVKLPEA
ncbi:WXG100 family type VII secretion target [Spirillospora sp. CA-253888]